jgi:hypothetical protein
MEQEAREHDVIRFMIYITRYIHFRRSNYGRLDGLIMWHARGKSEMGTGNMLGCTKERGQFEGLLVEG